MSSKRCGVFLLDVGMLVLWLISGLAKLFLSEAPGQARGWEKRKLVEVVTLLIYGSSFYKFVNTTLSWISPFGWFTTQSVADSCLISLGLSSFLQSRLFNYHPPGHISRFPGGFTLLANLLFDIAISTFTSCSKTAHQDHLREALLLTSPSRLAMWAGVRKHYFMTGTRYYNTGKTKPTEKYQWRWETATGVSH